MKTSVCVHKCVHTQVRAVRAYHTHGPGSRASWIHLSAAAPPEDLWALQWKSLAAPHSAGETKRKERRKGGREEEGMRMRCLNRVMNFAVNTFLKTKITSKLLSLKTGLDSCHNSNKLRASTSASMKDRVQVYRMLRVIGQPIHINKALWKEV